MNRTDLDYFYKQKVRVKLGVPHLTELRPFFYYGVITELTDTHLTLMQDHHKGVVRLEIDDIIYLKSRDWEVVR